MAEQAKAAGLVYRRTGTAVPVGALHDALRNRLYTGGFLWNGRRCKGCHEPLVTRELWERVRSVPEAGGERGAPFAEFRVFERDVEEREAFRHVPTTV